MGTLLWQCKALTTELQASPYNHVIKLTKLMERLMLKLKLQHFGHLIQKSNSLENTLILGKIEGGRRRG